MNIECEQIIGGTALLVNGKTVAIVLDKSLVSPMRQCLNMRKTLMDLHDDPQFFEGFTELKEDIYKLIERASNEPKF